MRRLPLHFVGSLPAELTALDDAEVLSWLLKQSAPHPVTALPRDLDPDWVVAYLRSLSGRDAFEVGRAGEYAHYDDMRVYRVRSGRTLRPEDVTMGRADRIREVLAAFRVLRERDPALADVRLQISQPSPLDLSAFVFGGAAVATNLPLGPAVRHAGALVTALRHVPTFTDAVVDEIAGLSDVADELVWQIESPIALLSMVRTDSLPGVRDLLARRVAAQLAGLLARLPATVHPVLHLCYGDYQHAELMAPTSLAPAVRLLNALGRALRRRGRDLVPVHVPCAYGAHPAPTDPAFYRPLAGLADEWPLIAGVASAAEPESGVESLAQFEAAAGRPAHAVATACGLGRHTPDAAERAIGAMRSAASAG